MYGDQSGEFGCGYWDFSKGLKVWKVVGVVIHITCCRGRGLGVNNMNCVTFEHSFPLFCRLPSIQNSSCFYWHCDYPVMPCVNGPLLTLNLSATASCEGTIKKLDYSHTKMSFHSGLTIGSGHLHVWKSTSPKESSHIQCTVWHTWTLLFKIYGKWKWQIPSCNILQNVALIWLVIL